MLEELEVLRMVSERLEAARLPFMLTGSFALAYYGKPRMTRDLDIVVSLREGGPKILDRSCSAVTSRRCWTNRWIAPIWSIGLRGLASPKLLRRSCSE